MTETKKFDLKDRTFEFAKKVRNFCSKLPKDLISIDDLKQLIRSSGSVGANYIEASEALSKKDFTMRIKISRKEAKESIYWLELLAIKGPTLNLERNSLAQEATELMKIFNSIAVKSQV